MRPQQQRAHRGTSQFAILVSARGAIVIALAVMSAGPVPMLHGQQADPDIERQAPQATTPRDQAAEPAVAPEDVTRADDQITRQEKGTVPLQAVVTEVSGRVDWAQVGTSPAAKAGWTPVKVDDRLVDGMQIRTGLRSYVNLRFGETTFISIRSATYVSLAEAIKGATVEAVRLDLGYGTVRGASTEGEIRSQVVVESTKATMAKRGTDGWEISVEPHTGRFQISLARYGLVEAIQRLAEGRSRSKLVRPGEYATNTNIANLWLKQAVFDRNVAFFEATAVTSSDSDFSTDHPRGYSVMAPGAGAQAWSLAARTGQQSVLQQMIGAGQQTPDLVVLTPPPQRRPDGNFGTGPSFRVLVPR